MLFLCPDTGQIDKEWGQKMAGHIDDKPRDCRYCCFWKKSAGCIYKGASGCYYQSEPKLELSKCDDFPYRRAHQAEMQMDKADVRALNKEFEQQNGGPSSNPYFRWQQKRAIKKEYAAVRAGNGAKNTAKASEAAAKAAIRAYIMHVRFINMGADDKGVLALGKSFGKLHSQPVDLLSGDLAGTERLPDMIGKGSVQSEAHFVQSLMDGTFYLFRQPAKILFHYLWYSCACSQPPECYSRPNGTSKHPGRW